VQKFIPGGKEVIVGATAEHGLGHMIMFGMGGVLVEILKDVSFCLTPVTAPEALDMVESIKTVKVLIGYRGDKGVDIPKLIDTIQRISQLVTENPQIGEMDLNPVAAFEHDIFVVDARIKLQNI
jgi:acetyltransferase